MDDVSPEFADFLNLKRVFADFSGVFVSQHRCLEEKKPLMDCFVQNLIYMCLG